MFTNEEDETKFPEVDFPTGEQETETETESPADGPDSQPAPEETNNEQPLEKGLGEKTQLDKATWSFKHQLGKQKKKYENIIQGWETKYNDLAARLEKLENPNGGALTRDQFQTDDDFINALVEQRFNDTWNAKLAEVQKQYEAQNKQNEEVNSFRSKAEENVKKLYNTPEAEKDYRDKIASALEMGLGDLIDEDPELAQYIIRSDIGPKIMYELATNQDSVRELFENTNSMDKQFKIRELESRIRNQMAKPVTPAVGRPGMAAETKPTSLFDDDERLREWLRTH